MRFSEEETCRFVELYRQHECLWDPSCNHYKNKKMRRAAYESMVLSMGKDGFGVEELKQKIKNLRCTYNQECAKIQKSMQPNSKRVYIPNIKWFNTMNDIYTKLRYELQIKEMMAVVTTCDKNRSSGDLVSQEAPPSSAPPPSWSVKTEEELDMIEDNYELEGQDQLFPSRLETPTLDLIQHCSPQDILDSPSTSIVAEKRPRGESSQSHIFSKIPRMDDTSSLQSRGLEPALNSSFIESRSQKEDQYDKFGQHIAAQLRELPLWNFIVLQEKIQCLITAERLSCLQPPNGSEAPPAESTSSSSNS